MSSEADVKALVETFAVPPVEIDAPFRRGAGAGALGWLVCVGMCASECVVGSAKGCCCRDDCRMLITWCVILALADKNQGGKGRSDQARDVQQRMIGRFHPECILRVFLYYCFALRFGFMQN